MKYSETELKCAINAVRENSIFSPVAHELDRVKEELRKLRIQHEHLLHSDSLMESDLIEAGELLEARKNYITHLQAAFDECGIFLFAKGFKFNPNTIKEGTRLKELAKI